jgi:enoyl-[acyl-carrier-protein] reductase (NADH)
VIQDPNTTEVVKTGVPLGRAGQAQDIANGVLFLASDASNNMTGVELVLDGGMTRRKTSVELNWTAGERALQRLRSATLAESSI